MEIHKHQTAIRICSVLEGSDASKRPHDMDIARLQVSLDAVEGDAEAESRACSKLAHLCILRLDSSRKAVERLLGILQACSFLPTSFCSACPPACCRQNSIAGCLTLFTFVMRHAIQLS